MKQLPRYICLVPAILIITFLEAQLTGTVKKWSLEDCFKYAAAHNIQVSSLRYNQQSSAQDLVAARGARIPGLSASVSNSFNNANNTGRNGGLVNQLTSGGSYAISSSIVLWNDNSINNNIRLKEISVQQDSLSVLQSLNDITLQITQNYLSILLAKENLLYIKELESTSTARVRQGQQLYDAGSIAKKDLLQLQAQAASDVYLRVQSENAIRQHILSLQQLLQIPADTLFDVVSPVAVTVVAFLLPLQEVQQAAIRDFPDSKIGKLNVDMASIDIARARAAFKPTLSANGSMGTGYNTVLTNAYLPKTGYFTQTGNNFYQRVGLSLSIPIFSNRINRTNLEKANIVYKQASLSWQNDQLLLTQAVEQAYLNAKNAMQSYDAANIQLQAATESYRISNEQFRLGAINTYDLLLQRNQYVQAMQSFIQAKYTALLDQKIYQFYTGKPVTL